MKDEKYVEIAQKLGVAKSTVSRAARHCSGVDAETRRAVLQYTGFFDESKGDGAQKCHIYTILPDLPGYFWGRLYHSIVDAVLDVDDRLGWYDQSVKQNMYNSLADTDIVLRYLEEAEKLQPSVLIIAAHVTPEIREKLNALKEKTIIFFVTELDSMPHTFYFGADPYQDGFRMGQHYCEHYADRSPVIVSNREINSIRLRTEGFLDALRGADSERFGTVPVYDFSTDGIFFDKRRLAPARLAAKLTEWIGSRERACLYVPYGSVALPLALQKAKFGENVVCLCHDGMLGEDCRPEEGISACINQDVYRHGRAAVEAAVKLITTGMCPDGKYTYIPSHLVLR